MNTIGNKRTKGKTMGYKNNGSNRMGNKFTSINKPTDYVLEPTKDGTIQNYANHPQTMAEPIKGIDMPKTKHNFQVEKPKNNKTYNSHYC